MAEVRLEEIGRGERIPDQFYHRFKLLKKLVWSSLRTGVWHTQPHKERVNIGRPNQPPDKRRAGPSPLVFRMWRL